MSPERSSDELRFPTFPEQYGNNFYMLFVAMGRESKGVDPGLIGFYPRKGEKLYGEQWQKFLKENAALLSEISDALELHVLGKGNDPEYDSDAAWNVVNPLLQEAGTKMADYGIDQKKFFG